MSAAPSTPSGCTQAAARLPDLVAERLAGAAGDERTAARALRELLRTEVYDVAVRASAEPERFAAVAGHELAGLAAAVTGSVPAGVEDRLGPRPRIFVRLLRRGALEPAWTLAQDGASGVVRPTRAVSMWAGGSHLNTALPLPTLIEGERVFAWLPGFRDPRWSVPDEVYDLERDVVVRGALDGVVLEPGRGSSGGRLVLHGSAFLGQLVARADDSVVVSLAGPGGAREAVTATRSRYPGRVADAGPELTRLAWSGWQARVGLAALARTPGTWRARIEIGQQGVRRTQELGLRRGPLADPTRPGPAVEYRGAAIRVEADSSGQLLVRVARLRPSARLVPAPIRRVARRVMPRG